MKDGADPRLENGRDSGSIGTSGPAVGKAVRKTSGVLIAGAFVLAAAVMFAILNAHRSAIAAPSLVAATSTPAQTPSAPLPALQVAAAPPPAALAAPPSKPPAAPAQLAPQVAALAPAASPAPDPMIRRRAPSVVFDLGSGPTELAATPVAVTTRATTNAASATPGAAANLAADTQANPQLASSGPDAGKLSPAAALGGAASLGAAGVSGATEQFARRVGEDPPKEAYATTLRNLSSLIPQGTVIPGVLETAINSDLPGFTRAIVSRDVRNFDGRTVLIPRGSRLIGQYRNAVALGESRAFVIWTRIIRPDGVSILIDSPGGDALGRGGLDGKVDRHFFTRFGGSILLSVLDAAIAAIGGVPTTQVTIGSPGAALGAASTVVNGDPIPPTINVAQGTTIRIFVARDLDFSGVGPAK
ncbi:MAG TPA: TrbI/VirB10 family protein [Micropepsaceae bacterium]|nr:TrbI/VirB10 family protein [Micropepsaceae bacterium]